MEYILWVTVIVASAIAEGVTAALVSIWFIAGGLAALVAQMAGAGLAVQVIIFLVVSLLVILFLRPVAVKVLYKNTDKALNSIVGKQAIVKERIDNINCTGEVFLEGKMWAAKSKDGSNIEEGTIVTVESVEGVKAIVSSKHGA